MRKTLDRASALITDSEYTRHELAGYFGWPIERIHAVPLASSVEFCVRHYEDLRLPLARYGLAPGNYSLFVGTIEPRKNIDTLLDAYGRLPVAIRNRWPLILTGYQGWRNEQIRQRIEQAEAEGWARYLGFVPASDLPLLFSGARLFTFPSLYEGFGLPVLEAMSSGVPVVCSNSSLPEVAGKAALMSEPLDVETLTDNLRRGLEDEHWRSSAIDKGCLIPLCFLGSAAPAKPSPCIKRWPVADAENPAFFKTYYPRTMGGIEQVIFQLAEGGAGYGYTGEVLYLSHQGGARSEPYASHITHRSNLDFEMASTGFPFQHCAISRSWLARRILFITTSLGLIWMSRTF